MANTKQALKRSRQSEKNRIGNKWQITRMNTHIKQVLEAIKKGEHSEATTAYQKAVSIIDKLANKGLIHRNKAARHKSRLNKQVVALAS